jgi:uncharacterized cupin superfamily protein
MEARVRQTEHGLVAETEGWYVLNARDAAWRDNGELGVYTRLGEGEIAFPELGINIGVLQPGQPACMYHREPNQEDFLVLSGECVLLVEGEERRLRAWDFFHCPADTEHVIVGAGDGPCAVLAVGSRGSRGVVYPRSEVALRHRAGVESETDSPQEAYAGYEDAPVAYREGWLPEPEPRAPGGV